MRSFGSRARNNPAWHGMHRTCVIRLLAESSGMVVHQAVHLDAEGVNKLSMCSQHLPHVRGRFLQKYLSMHGHRSKKSNGAYAAIIALICEFIRAAAIISCIIAASTLGDTVSN